MEIAAETSTGRHSKSLFDKVVGDQIPWPRPWLLLPPCLRLRLLLLVELLLRLAFGAPEERFEYETDAESSAEVAIAVDVSATVRVPFETDVTTAVVEGRNEPDRVVELADARELDEPTDDKKELVPALGSDDALEEATVAVACEVAEPDRPGTADVELEATFAEEVVDVDSVKHF